MILLVSLLTRLGSRHNRNLQDMEANMRRTGICFAAVVSVALSSGVAPRAALGQTYSNQDIHFIAAFPPGSGSDILVRFYANKLRAISGNTVIVENKPGAGGNIAAEYVARSKPDGSTILVHNGTSVAANYHLFKKPPIDPAQDLKVAATITNSQFTLIVDAKSPYQTLSQLTEALKAKGAKASYGQATTFAKVLGELYKKATGVTAVDVPYRTTGDYMNDLASGGIDFAIMDPVAALASVTESRVRILAVSSPRRVPGMADYPTFAESGVDVSLTLWWGAMVPSATPPSLINQLNGWVGKMLAMDDTRKFIQSNGGEPFGSTSEEGQALMLKTKADWDALVKLAQIEPQ